MSYLRWEKPDSNLKKADIYGFVMGVLQFYSEKQLWIVKTAASIIVLR